MIYADYREDCVRVRERLASLLGDVDCPGQLRDGMRYAVNSGKLLRPCLLLRVARELGRTDDGVLSFAAALELLHTASLLHDDLPCVDNDALRRGQPANHVVYGEALALLQGDALLNFAYTVLFHACRTENDLAAARYISRAAGADGMLGGQYKDVVLTGCAATAEQVWYVADRKTAALFRAAICGGALLAGREAISELEQAATRLGVAFQIADDLIDCGYGVRSEGKTLGKDFSAGKNSYPAVFGIERSFADLRRNSSEVETADVPEIIRTVARYVAESVDQRANKF